MKSLLPNRSRLPRLIQIFLLAVAATATARAAEPAPDPWLTEWRRTNAVWRGVQLSVQSDGAADALIEQVPKLAALGVNALVMEVNYNYAFTSHPELASARPMSKEKARELAKTCRANGIRPIPLFNCLGHQSWAKNTFSLLTKYPEFDETPDAPKDNQGLYCRSWCPQHPGVNPIVFALIDDLVDGFQADAVHVGMDEVFILASEQCPRCKGGDTARLFARAVNDLHGHIVGERKLEMLMWGDRFLDGKATHYGKWEASENGTQAAIDLVPKDIILCDWHYEKRADYPSLQILLSKGFRVWPTGWKKVEATEAFVEASKQQHNDRMLGHLCSTWGAVKIPNLAEWPPIIAGITAWTK